MSGHHPFSALRKRQAPARRARNAEATRRMLAEMTLRKLRRARKHRRGS